MPHFPLPYAGTPGGIDGADVQHQPGDVSFVIDQVLADASSEDTVFAGLVDDEKIGVAGHSDLLSLGGLPTTDLACSPSPGCPGLHGGASATPVPVP